MPVVEIREVAAMNRASETRTTRPPIRPASPIGRLAGIDVLRALAILGMVWMHFRVTGWWSDLDGPAAPELAWVNSLLGTRSRDLFFVLAGVTVALTTGGLHGSSGNRDRMRVLVRAGVLFVLAMVLGELGSWDAQILHFYAFWLVLLVPLTLLPARSLFPLAAVLAVTMPVVKIAATRGGWFEPDMETMMSLYEHGGFALLAHPGDWLPLAQNIVFGASPTSQDTLSVLPFLVMGLALGRLDLRSDGVRRRLVALGAAVAAGAVAIGIVATSVLDAGAAIAAVDDLPPAAADAQTPWQLLVALDHPGPGTAQFSITETVAMGGIIATLLGTLLVLMDRPRWKPALRPMAAFGSMALTWYFAHFLVLSSGLFTTADGPVNRTVAAFAIAVVVASVPSLVLHRWARRGPLEWLQHTVIETVLPRTRTPHRGSPPVRSA
ncbi:acyltransferase family protein [Pseudonocardia phyllosphaerae]|uniref:acyltransferase family protein n=1 Tax=Pseudonocardia phyllosphaerae TaxID=3390502 RepID=UPI00397C968D